MILIILLVITVGYLAIGTQIARIKKVNKKSRLNIDEIFGYVFFWPIVVPVELVEDYVNRPDNNR